MTAVPDKDPSIHPFLPALEITEQGVFNILFNYNPSKSPGPDSVHPYVIKTTQQLKFLLCLRTYVSTVLKSTYSKSTMMYPVPTTVFHY